VLFAGKLIPKKRPHDLIEAAQLMSDSRVHLLFAGDGEMSESLYAGCDVRFGPDLASAGSRAPGRVAASFTGFLNQTEVATAYAAADCLVLPSDDRETWGLVVNEAMASGLPCIVSDACGCAEDMVAPIDAELTFRVGAPEDLARAIRHLMQRPPAPDRIAAQVARFSLDRTAETIVMLAGTASGAVSASHRA
jgi:glycosyltransferase involved in cell wall biosynthesis